MKGLVATGLLLLIFAAIAAIVAAGHFEDFDRAVMLAMRTGDTHDPIGPQWVETMFLDFTALGSNTTVTLVTLAAAGFLLIDRKPATTMLIIAAAAGGTILNNLLKFGFDRARPDLVAHIVEVQTTSFPSGHAMLSAVVYLTLGGLLARTQRDPAVKAYIIGAAALVTALIGISRIYLGVHWPSDVIAGWCAGGAWALICWEIARRLQHSGQVEEESD